MRTQSAELSGGQFSRAAHTGELEEVYRQIDRLERSEVEEIIYTDYEDLYMRFLLPGLLLGFLALISDRVIFRSPAACFGRKPFCIQPFIRPVTTTERGPGP